jgi:hypothetical protein
MAREAKAHALWTSADTCCFHQQDVPGFAVRTPHDPFELFVALVFERLERPGLPFRQKNLPRSATASSEMPTTLLVAWR